MGESLDRQESALPGPVHEPPEDPAAPAPWGEAVKLAPQPAGAPLRSEVPSMLRVEPWGNHRWERREMRTTGQVGRRFLWKPDVTGRCLLGLEVRKALIRG